MFTDGLPIQYRKVDSTDKLCSGWAFLVDVHNVHSFTSIGQRVRGRLRSAGELEHLHTACTKSTDMYTCTSYIRIGTNRFQDDPSNVHDAADGTTSIRQVEVHFISSSSGAFTDHVTALLRKPHGQQSTNARGTSKPSNALRHVGLVYPNHSPL